ncbi:MAG TPA: hypothetical protein VFB79_21995 [Candidatus Angelobacter sp.]|nr:hypothetical protein [Candidatus Angelobacter sp.]
MVYTIKVTPQHERETQIAASSQNPIERSAFHEYQNATQLLPVIRLPIDVPIYRMANGRTRTAQLQYIRSHKLSINFFSAGQENQDAQQAQHNILDRFSKEGTASIIPIATVLGEGRQTEPILITAAGIVVNGNRRLAAMRELYASGEASYSGFSHVICKVLPSAVTPKEIKEIEIRLQMQPETRLPYTWVNEALTIKDLMLTGFTRDEIARDMRKQPRDVDVALQALSHAEIYLKDWRKASEEYDLVEGAEQMFGDMAKLLKDKTGDELELSRRIAFVIQDNSKELGVRAYAFNFSFGRKSDAVAEALATRLGVDLTAPPMGSSHSSESLDIDIDDETEGASYKPLIDLLDDPTRREEVAEELVSVCESIRATEQDEKRGQAALKAAKDANTKLLELDIATADPSTYSAINAQLDSVIARATKLKEEVTNASSKPKSPATAKPQP